VVPFPEEVLLYAAAAGLAVFAAAAELIGRFRDEPFRVVFSRPGSIYLLLNAALAAVVLAGLRYVETPRTGVAAMEQLLLAGFGARVVLRTKLVSARGKEGVDESGPGAVFEKLLATISRSADRNRATRRLQLVSKLLAEVDWLKIRDFFPAELAGALQDLTAKEIAEIAKAREFIEGHPDLDEHTRVDLLGYMILAFGGEEFLEELSRLYRERFPTGPPGPGNP
jgi:hypothetical protein